ncbi:MAG TPA: anti-sigma factor [Myxococcaceae bacterium]|nr:anti-sigma factor [Myxococcaceae bacterium]
MSARPISEDDLQAYVDETLEADRRAEVAEYLSSHPEEARRIERYREQRASLRAALDPIAEEPLPPELNLARMIQARRRPSLAWTRWAAAAAVLLCIGGVTGWSVRGATQTARRGIGALAGEAADSYQVYASDRVRPVEMGEGDRARLVEWASARLGRPVSVPDLSGAGYRFMGGRMVATPHGPAALFMYDDDRGTRLVLLTREMDVDRNMPMSEHSRNGLEGVAWSSQGIGYSLVGPTSSELRPLANEVRRQLGNSL